MNVPYCNVLNVWLNCIKIKALFQSFIVLIRIFVCFLKKQRKLSEKPSYLSLFFVSHPLFSWRSTHRFGTVITILLIVWLCTESREFTSDIIILVTCSMYYAQKFREYILGTSRIARLDAKQEHIRQTLLDAAGDSPTSLKGLQQLHTGQTTKPPRRKRIGRLQMNGQPKLFGGSLEEYLETTNQEIPLIIKSCIRVINLYGG